MSENQNMISKILYPFITFILLFIGAGFISGGIVHLGEGLNAWDISLLVGGIFLFVLGSYIQEILFNKNNLREEGVIPFLIYSLFLSIGIGMASGGTQHFVDTPEYSMYLIPIGLFIGLIAFVLKQNIRLSQRAWIKMLVSTLIFTLMLGVVLSFVNSAYLKDKNNQKGSHNSNEQTLEGHHINEISKEIPHGH